MIAKELLMQFKNNLKFTAGIDRQYSKEFAVKGAKIGNSVTIRKPPRFTVNSGPGINIENVVEESTTLTLSSQKHVDFQFTSQDMTLTIDEFSKRYLAGAGLALANQVDLDGLTMAAQSAFNTVGVSGTAPAGAGATGAILTYLQAGQKLDELAAPMDGQRSLFINPAAQAGAVAALSGLFQSSSEIGEQYKKGRMGEALGNEWYMAQNIYSYTTGAQGGTPVVSGAGQTGSSLNTSGWSNSVSNLLQVGDVFTIAGVYKVNPITKQSTGVLQQFVVQAAASSNGSAIPTGCRS